ncbi:MAG: hypothetical protein HOP16_00370 [Acidobacteria bacterium]|nr:hypothetical protein [Acidobacteriota bacterium]
MSLFDLSLMSVPPESGTDALAAGVPTGPKDEAPSDAFAQLLAQLSGVSEEDLTLATVSEATVEDLELATEALSMSPDGWDDARLEPGSAPVEDGADEPAASPLLLTGFLMPLPVAQDIARSSKGNQSIEETKSVAEPPAARSVTDGLAEVPAQNAADGKPAGTVPLADQDTSESRPQLAAGKTPVAPSPELPVGNVHLSQFDGSVPQVEDKAAAENVHTSVADAVSHGEATSRGGTSEAPAAAARNRNSTEDSTRIANTPAVNVSEMAASLERRAASEGESQPELAPRTSSMPSGSVGQPQQVVQTFHQAVAAALHAAETSAAPATPSADPGGLDNQIVQGIRRLWRDGTEEIRVTLRPEYLGALTISLKVDQNAVSAVLHVDEPQVRAWVQAHEAQLRQAMSSQGLSLEQLVITDEKPGKEDRRRDAEARQNRRPNAGRPSDEPASVFEVAV